MGRCFSAYVYYVAFPRSDIVDVFARPLYFSLKREGQVQARRQGVSFLDMRLGRDPCIKLIGGLFAIVVFFAFDGSRARKSKRGAHW